MCPWSELAVGASVGASQCSTRWNLLPMADPVALPVLSHRMDVARQLRCELLVTRHAGESVRSLPDVLPDDFTPLPR
jgi:hypothetical protein